MYIAYTKSFEVKT